MKVQSVLGKTAPQEAAEAKERAKFFEVMKANPGKSEAEIHAMMSTRRIWFFVLLGPFLIWLIFLAFALALAQTSNRADLLFEDWRWFPASLLGCYGIALLPLLVIANIDHRLSRYRWRVLVCFLVGFGMNVALFYSLAEGEAAEKEFQQDWFVLGLMVGLPAAVCSWLSGRYATDG